MFPITKLQQTAKTAKSTALEPILEDPRVEELQRALAEIRSAMDAVGHERDQLRHVAAQAQMEKDRAINMCSVLARERDELKISAVTVAAIPEPQPPMQCTNAFMVALGTAIKERNEAKNELEIAQVE